jgi:hypothetical protein
MVGCRREMPAAGPQQSVLTGLRSTEGLPFIDATRGDTPSTAARTARPSDSSEVPDRYADGVGELVALIYHHHRVYRRAFPRPRVRDGGDLLGRFLRGPYE